MGRRVLPKGGKVILISSDEDGENIKQSTGNSRKRRALDQDDGKPIRGHRRALPKVDEAILISSDEDDEKDIKQSTENSLKRRASDSDSQDDDKPIQTRGTKPKTEKTRVSGLANDFCSESSDDESVVSVKQESRASEGHQQAAPLKAELSDDSFEDKPAVTSTTHVGGHQQVARPKAEPDDDEASVVVNCVYQGKDNCRVAHFYELTSTKTIREILAIVHKSEDILRDITFLSRRPPANGGYLLNPSMVCISHHDPRAFTLAEFLLNFGGARRDVGCQPKNVSAQGGGCPEHSTKEKIMMTVPAVLSFRKHGMTEALIHFMWDKKNAGQSAKILQTSSINICHNADCCLAEDLAANYGSATIYRHRCKNNADPNASHWPWECADSTHHPRCNIAKAMVSPWERKFMEWMVGNNCRTLDDIPVSRVGSLSAEDLDQPFYNYDINNGTVRRLERYTLVELVGEDARDNAIMQDKTVSRIVLDIAPDLQSQGLDDVFNTAAGQDVLSGNCKASGTSFDWTCYLCMSQTYANLPPSKRYPRYPAAPLHHMRRVFLHIFNQHPEELQPVKAAYLAGEMKLWTGLRLTLEEKLGNRATFDNVREMLSEGSIPPVIRQLFLKQD